MNERTKDVNQRVYDIWRQAASTVSPLKTGGDWQKDFVKKFAELIVKECIEISQVGSITETKLKKHFGVEEPEQSAADRILSTVRKRS